MRRWRASKLERALLRLRASGLFTRQSEFKGLLNCPIEKPLWAPAYKVAPCVHEPVEMLEDSLHTREGVLSLASHKPAHLLLTQASRDELLDQGLSPALHLGRSPGVSTPDGSCISRRRRRAAR